MQFPSGCYSFVIASVENSTRNEGHASNAAGRFRSRFICDERSCDAGANGTASANFTDANLTSAIFDHATLDAGTTFTRATLVSTSWSGVSLAASAAGLDGISTGSITNAPLTLPTGWKYYRGYFVGPYANLDNADFSGVDLTGAVFAGIDLSNANLRGANLTNAKFIYNVNITGINLANATLTGLISEVAGAPGPLPAHWVAISDASGSEHLLGPGAYVYGAYGQLDFNGVNLQGIDLAGATFEMTNLQNANLSNTNLSGATFPYADLTNARLLGANFSGANLNNANLTYVDFSKLVPNPIGNSGAAPTGGATATYSATICPDGGTVTSPATCVSRGFLN